MFFTYTNKYSVKNNLIDNAAHMNQANALITHKHENHYMNKKDILQVFYTDLIDSQKRFLDEMVFYCINFKSNFVSQSTIGAKIGLSRRQVCRIAKQLAEKGLIEKKRRFDKTSVYKLNPLIYQLASELKPLLPNLRFILQKSLLFTLICGSFSANVSLISSKFNNNPVPVLERDYITRATPPSTGQGTGIFNKKIVELENSMENVPKPPISPTLRKATELLKLTKLGQIKLMVFSESVLNHAISLYKPSTTIKNPFDWVFLAAKKHCDRVGQKPDWELYYRLLIKYNIVDNKQYVQVPVDQTNQMLIKEKTPKKEVVPLKSFNLSEFLKGKSKEAWNKAAQYALPPDCMDKWNEVKDESVCD